MLQTLNLKEEVKGLEHRLQSGFYLKFPIEILLVGGGGVG